MKVKVNEKEVSWLLKSFNINTGSQANDMLQTQLGADLAVCFAVMQLGYHFYTWELPGDGWLKRSEVLPNEVELVNAAYQELQTAVRKKVVNAMMANTLLTVPNDDFVYYQIESSGKVRIMLTGWGFRNYQGPQSGAIKRKLSQPEAKQTIRIAWTVAGKPVSQREFYCQFLYQKKPNLLATPDDGYYLFEQPQAIGTTIQIVDKVTSQKFDLIVTEGQRDYEYDVTQYCTTTVTIQQDGMPKVNEQVIVQYNEKEIQLQTDALGCTSISLPYIVNSEVEVWVGDSKKQQIVELNGNHFEFVFTTPPPSPSPVKDAKISVCVVEDGEPKSGESVTISYSGKSCTLQTDNSGRVVTALPYIESCEVVAKVRDLMQQKIIGVDDNDFMFSFTTQLPPPPPSPSREDAQIIIRVMQDGKPKSSEPVTVGYRGKNSMLQTDNSGQATIVLPYLEECEVIVNVRDLMQQKTIVSGDNDFMFTFTTQASSSEQSSPVMAEIELCIEEIEGRPLANQEITLKQGDRQYTYELDNNGCCCFGRECFVAGKEVVVILPDNTGKQIQVPLIIEEDEYKYLVVGQIKKTSPWMIVLEAALLVTTAAILSCLAPYFVGWAQEVAHSL